MTNIKLIITLLLTLFSLQSFAQLSISPAPVNGDIDLDTVSATITFGNPSATPVVMNISLTPKVGFSMSINRCAGKTLTKNQTCYIIVNVNDSLLASGVNTTTVTQDGISLFNVNRTKIQGSGSSNFTQSPAVQINNFTSYDILIQNLTPIIRSYNPVLSGTDASKYSITLNRCSNVGVGKICSISLKLAPQLAGNYSVVMSELQVIGSLNIFSTISGSTSGVLVSQIKSVSVNPLSLNFGTLINYGQSTQKQIVIITNTGNTAIIPVVTLSSRVKMVLNRCNILVSPGRACSIMVTVFIGTDINSVETLLNEKIQVKSEASGSTIEIPVSLSTNIVIYCRPGTHQLNSECVSDVAHSTERACSIIPSGQVNGIEYFDNNLNDWAGFCSARYQSDCDTGWTFNALAQSCLNSESGVVTIGTLPAGYSLVKDVNESMSYGNPFSIAHSACTVTSSNLTFVGHTYEILTSNAYPTTNGDCGSIKSAVLNRSVRVVDSFSTCEIRLPVEGKTFLLAKPNSLDPNFCYNLNLSSASYQSAYKTKYDVFGANPTKLTEFDGRIFYLREMAPIQSGNNHHQILSSTNGNSGNSIDHSSNLYSIKSIEKFDNKLYIIAEVLSINPNKINYLFRLDNASQTLTASSVPILSGQAIDYLLKVEDILVVVGNDDYYHSPTHYLGYINSGGNLVTQLINNDRELVTLNLNSGTEHVEASDFVKVGNKLYSRNPYSEFSDYFDYDQNSNFVNYNQIYDVYDLTTGYGEIALSLKTQNDPSGNGWLTKLFSVGTKRYAMLNEKLYEIDTSTQSLSLVKTFESLLGSVELGASGTAYISSYNAAYSTALLHKLNSVTNSVSLISGDFPFWTKMIYNPINGKLLLAQDGSFEAKEIDDNGTITSLPSSTGVHIDAPITNIGGKLYFIGEGYQGSRLFVYNNGSITQLPDLCIDRPNNQSTNSYGKIFNIFNRTFGGMIGLNGSVFFPGNSCQNEARSYDLYGNYETLYELFKYTPAP